MLRWRRVEISGGFLLLAAALYYLDNQGVILWAALACALHELGHYAAIRAFGGRVVLLRLTCIGAEMVLSSRGRRGRSLTWLGRLCTALGGPWANLALAALSARLAWLFGERAWLFAGLNLALAAFNLLPVEQLDGGRVLAVLLSLFLPDYLVRQVMGALSIGISLGLTAAGAALFFGAGGSVTLLLTALWLLAASAGAFRRNRGGRFPANRFARRR